MKLEFLGTRGNIEARSDRHWMHTVLLVSYYDKEVLIDFGADWSREDLEALDPLAVVVTHGHLDHVDGLKQGAPCPVYAPEAAWEAMRNFDIEERETLPHREPVEIEGITFEAFPVEHSERMPAVGYRVTAGRVTIFYVPDLVSIPAREAALAGVRAYVGDGATVNRPILRYKEDQPIGHTSIKEQLAWCGGEGVPRAIFTHCGSQIVEGEPGEMQAWVRDLGEEQGVEAEIAHDGMEVILR